MHPQFLPAFSLGAAILGIVAAAAAPGLPAEPAGQAAAGSAGAVFFEAKIRPLLVRHCLPCHKPGSVKGGLLLDTAAGFRKGGVSGPLFHPDRPAAESLLLRALRHEGPLRMPPAGRLSPAQLSDVETWLRGGAPWGLEKRSGARASGPHWSFQPVRRPTAPRVRNVAWARDVSDRFLLARLESAGLGPSRPAAPRDLIRRLAFDLTGLPPSWEDAERFVRDPSDAAYERLVDGYLASPRFGERWARHWLDVVRFAQTNGYERDDEKPHIWRYRDYVIRSLNEDRPYDQFLREQIAGDELSPRTEDGLIATGFYRLGVWDDEPDDLKQAEFDNLDDVLATMGQAFLGLTIGCARCHDHKFDPLPQAEYYSLLAYIRNIRRYAVPGKDTDAFLFADLSDGGKAQVVRENEGEPPRTQVLLRGIAATPAQEVTPAFPAMLGRVSTPDWTRPADMRTSGRRRLLAEWVTSPDNPLTARVRVNRIWQVLFGKPIVPTPNDFGVVGLPPSHPELLDHLAAEFVAGGWRTKPLVRRLVLSAAYRQSSAAADEKARRVDPGNLLLWRQALRRLPAEAIRDSILAASGQLNLEAGGRGIFPELPPEVLSTQSRPGNGWVTSPPEQQGRRSIYIFAKRTLGVPFLESFDAPVPDSPVSVRPTTTIAPQALILLNSAFMDQQSARFAERLLREASASDEARVQRSFQVALSRSPTEEERRVGREFLERRRAEPAEGDPADRDRKALARWCKVVLNLNEFVYID